MSLQYLADIESTAGSNEEDDIFALHWLEEGIILGGSAKGHLHAWHAKSGNYLGEAENRVHGFGIHSISSSQQNHVVLTAALDGSIALWDSSELGDFLQSFKANTDEVEEGSSRIQQSDLFPLKLIRSMTYAKQEKTESKAVTEIDGGSDLQNIPAIDSKRPYCALLHPTEPIFMTTGSKAELIIRSYDRSSRQIGRLITTIPSEEASGSQGRGQVTEHSSSSKKRDFGLSLLMHESGEIVALGTNKGFVHLFHIKENKLLTTINASRQAVRCLHLTPNDELLVGGNDGNVSVFDVQGFMPKSLSKCGIEDEDLFDDGLDEFAEDFTQSQHSIHTMSQSSTVSSIFSQTQSARSASLKPVRSWSSNSRWLTDVKASSDGRIVATSSIDGHVRIWDFKNPATQALCNITQDKEIWALEWKPTARDEAIEHRTDSQERSAKRCKTIPINSSAMTAAAQSVKTASTFVTAGADGKVRWYRMAGSNANDE